MQLKIPILFPLRLVSCSDFDQHFWQEKVANMAASLQANRLGWQTLRFKSVSNLETFPVTVRRQDSTIENVMLMDELMRFLDKEMPEAASKYLAYPQSFGYNQEALKRIQGFPQAAQTIDHVC